MKNFAKTLAMSLALMITGLFACVYGVLVGNDLTMTVGGILIIIGLAAVDS